MGGRAVVVGGWMVEVVVKGVGSVCGEVGRWRLVGRCAWWQEEVMEDGCGRRVGGAMVAVVSGVCVYGVCLGGEGAHKFAP